MPVTKEWITPVTTANSKLGTSGQPWGEINANSFKKSGQELATLASPDFTGNPTAPTQSAGDNSTKLATTAYADAAAAARAAATHASNHVLGGSDEIDGDQLDIDITLSNITPDTTPAEVSNAAHLGAIIKGIDNALAASAPQSHKATHISGGSDEIDGDQLDIDVSFSNITADTAPTEVSATAHLGAVLKGIDNALGTLGSSAPAHKSTHITGGSDEIDGDQLDIDVSFSNITPDTSPTQVTSTAHLGAVLFGIDNALGNKAAASHKATHISGGTDEIDGDQLDIDITLSNITPDTTPAEVSSAAHLGAIIKGIDNALGASVYSDEDAVDAVASQLGSTNSIEWTYDDGGDNLEADLKKKPFASLTGGSEGEISIDSGGVSVKLGTTNKTAGRGDWTPTSAQKDALAGAGTPSASNYYVTQAALKIGSNVASAATLPIVEHDGNYVNVTGATTITAFADIAVGYEVCCRFAAALTLTHHATDLILPGGSNITTAAGDHGIFRQYAAGDWRCTFYQKADGTALIASSVNEFADNVFRIQDNGDATKEIAFEASGITTGTARTITMPDANVDLTANSGTFAAAAHASRHLTGGADEIDGDKIDIDYTPSSYTPTTAPSEADNLDNLTAHLAGIDTALGAGGGGLSNVVDDTTPQLGGLLDYNNFCTTITLTNSTGGDIGVAGELVGVSIDSGTDTMAEVSANDSNLFFGVIYGVVSNTSTGVVYVHGVVPGVDTSSFSIGDLLYLPNTGGSGLTNTKPTSGVIKINPVGYVLESDAASGRVFLFGPLALEDVAFTAFNETFGGNIQVGGQAYSPTATLTDAATIATNCDNGNVFEVTLGGNRTLGAPSNLKDGATYIWRIIQDGTGSRTLSFNAVFNFPGGAAPTLSTAAGSVDIITGVSDGTNIDCAFQLDMQ